MSAEATRINELVERIKNSSPFDSLKATRELIELSRHSDMAKAEEAARSAAPAPTLDEQVRAALSALKTPTLDEQLAHAEASLREPILEAMRNLETALAAANGGEPGVHDSAE